MIVAIAVGAVLIAVSVMLADELGKLAGKLDALIWALDADRKGLACVIKSLDLTLDSGLKAINAQMMEISDALAKLEGIQDQLSAIDGWGADISEKLKEVKT